MQWKLSSSLARITSFFLLLAGDLIIAQIDAPICTDTVSSWGWSFNSLDQDPCLVTAYMMSTCYGGGNIFSNSACTASCPHLQQRLSWAPSSV
ncbi:hypothetical protein H4582DRAFT_2034761 [Lactarius indigo]|nr:hypothetical protein H4582DRAFT_2034761 [Lactarius indigo]